MPEPRHRKFKSKQDYETPPEFLRAAKRLLGLEHGFAFDFAARADNSKAYRKEKDFWSPSDDALSKRPDQWAAKCGTGWGWLNPPYTDIGAWALKCAHAKIEGARIALLVPAGVGSNWFRDYVYGDACVLLLNGRITFVGSTECYPKDSLLILWDNRLVDGFYIWTWPYDDVTDNLHVRLFEENNYGKHERQRQRQDPRPSVRGVSRSGRLSLGED